MVQIADRSQMSGISVPVTLDQRSCLIMGVAAARLTRTLPELAWREIVIFWHFIKYNVSTTIIPGPIFTIASLVSAHASPIKALSVLTVSLVHFSLYIYCFDF